MPRSERGCVVAVCKKILNNFKSTVLCHFIFLCTLPAFAKSNANNFTAEENTSNFGIEPRSWQFEGAQIDVLLQPPSAAPFTIETSDSKLAPTAAVVRMRLEASLTRPEVADPIVLRLKTNDARKLIQQLGNSAAIDALSFPTSARAYLTKFTERMRQRVRNMRLTLLPEDLAWIDVYKLSQTLAHPTTTATITESTWKKLKEDPKLTADANEFFQGRFPAIRKKVERWRRSNKGEDIPVKLLLPDHLQNLIGYFNPYRGRNCFATALSFFDKQVVGRPTVNIVSEPQHDRGMINSDEFSHALWLGYYELSGQEIIGGLRFGDVVVFVDDGQEDDYRAFRHAAVHVAHNLYFHKQSKSAASPIEFVDWGRLVTLWTPLTKKLDYKVYRKLPMGSTRYQKQRLATEKIFWSH